MDLVQIDEIDLHQLKYPGIAFKLNSPEPGRKEKVHSIEFNGWVRSRKSSFKSLTVRDSKSGSFSTHSVRRAGSGRGLKKLLSQQKNQRFNFSVGVIGFPLEFELVFSGILEDNSVVKLATIKGVREPVRSSFKPSLQPLVLNSLGRTGTTMLMRLLSAHPHIVAQMIHPYEVHASSYWMQFLKVLSGPYSASPQQDAQDFLLQHSTIGPNPTYDANYVKDHHIKNWIGVRYIEDMAAFCQQSLEGYYLNVAASQNEIASAYFVEKYSPSHIPWIIWELYPKAKEIILVRDFRDMLSSINAFNAKRGFLGFGRKRVLTDEEYVEQLGQKGILNLYRAWLTRRDKVHLVRYEDVILNPMSTVRSILQYLELDHSDDIVRAMVSAVTTSESKKEQDHKTSNSPEESIGRWMKDLSPSLQALCEKEFGAILKEFGYQ